MTAKEFIEDWYGTPIPPDWDLEHEPLQNLSINDLERMLNQYALSIVEKALHEQYKNIRKAVDDWCNGKGEENVLDVIDHNQSIPYMERSKITSEHPIA